MNDQPSSFAGLTAKIADILTEGHEQAVSKLKLECQQLRQQLCDISAGVSTLGRALQKLPSLHEFVTAGCKSSMAKCSNEDGNLRSEDQNIAGDPEEKSADGKPSNEEIRQQVEAGLAWLLTVKESSAPSPNGGQPECHVELTPSDMAERLGKLKLLENGAGPADALPLSRVGSLTGPRASILKPSSSTTQGIRSLTADDIRNGPRTSILKPRSSIASGTRSLTADDISTGPRVSILKPRSSIISGTSSLTAEDVSATGGPRRVSYQAPQQQCCTVSERSERSESSDQLGDSAFAPVRSILSSSEIPAMPVNSLRSQDRCLPKSSTFNWSLDPARSTMLLAGDRFILREDWWLDTVETNDGMFTKVRGNSRRGSNRSSASCQSLNRASWLAKVRHPHEKPLSIKRLSTCMMHPDGQLRLLWDLIGLLFVGYDAIVIPLFFFVDIGRGEVKAMDGILCSFWTLDVFVSCRTAVYIHGVLESAFRMVMLTYLKSWFTLDVLIVSLGWMEFTMSMSAGTSGKGAVFARSLRFARFFKFLRLLRLWKCSVTLRHLLERVNSSNIILCIDIVRLVVGLAFVNHLIACLWIAVGKTTTDGWTSQVFISDFRSISTTEKYLAALQWSLSNLQGQSEIYPVTSEERVFVCLYAGLALVLVSSFVSSLTNMMLQLQEVHRQSNEHQRILRKFLLDHHISWKLSAHVKKFIRSRDFYSQAEDKNLGEALRMLPVPMRMDLSMQARGKLLVVHPFFHSLLSGHPRCLRQLCHQALSEMRVAANETVFEVGDACKDMLIVDRCFLHYTPKRYVHIAASLLCEAVSFNPERQDGGFTQSEASVLQHGDWICEPTLWTRWENNGRAVTSSYGILFSINCVDFAKNAKEFHNAYVTIGAYANCFVNFMNSGVNCDDLMHLPQEEWVVQLAQRLDRQGTDDTNGITRSVSASAGFGFMTSIARITQSALHQILPSNVARVADEFDSLESDGYRSEGSRQGKELVGIKETDTY